MLYRTVFVSPYIPSQREVNMASVCLVSHALHLSLNFQWQWPPSPINGSFVSQAPHNSVTFQQSQLYASHLLLLQFLSLYNLCTIAELLLIKQFDKFFGDDVQCIPNTTVLY